MDLPRLLLSSVVRGSQQGDSHGGLFLVDMAARASTCVLDWNTGGISFEGRGADRGLRGIVLAGQDVYVAASDELFVLDSRFRIVASFRNAFLKHCHEMSLHDGKLWLTSTGFNSLLRFDLASRRFDLGLALAPQAGALSVAAFDPDGAAGPSPSATLHINNVHVDDTGVYLSGRHIPALIRIQSGAISAVSRLPPGTHNARPFRGGVLFNDTESDCVRWLSPQASVSLPVPRHDPAGLTGVGLDQSGLARQAFGRGLCVLSDTLVAAGSSPTTVAIHDLGAGRTPTTLQLTNDVRHAAHGLAIWPF